MRETGINNTYDAGVKIYLGEYKKISSILNKILPITRVIKNAGIINIIYMKITNTRLTSKYKNHVIWDLSKSPKKVYCQ